MWKWLLGALVLAGAGYVGYDTYRYYKMGGFSMPELEADDFPVAFRSGFKGILKGIKNERDTRKYLGYPAKGVSPLYQDSWSICHEPGAEERRDFESFVDLAPGERLDAICEINADGDVFIRGWVTSAPDI